MFVYIIINSANQKYYIGKTVNKNLDYYLSRQLWCAYNPDKSRTSKPHLFNAMRKYPRECWSIAPLVQLQTEEDLLAAEKFLIEIFGARRYGYNICVGGRGTIGWVPSAETRARQRASNLGKEHKPFTPEQEARRLAAWQKVLEEKNGSFQTPESIEKIKTARAKQDESRRFVRWEEKEKKDGAEYHKRAGLAHRGKKHTMSSEGSAKLSENFALIAHKRWHVNRGTINPTCVLCIRG